MAEILTEAILESYERTTKDLIQSNDSIKEVIFEDALFQRYVRNITEPILEADREIYESTLRVLSRERQALIETLTEQTDLVNDGKALAVAYLFFPLLADIYANPTLSKLPLVYPLSNPKFEIDMKRYIAEVIGADGRVVGDPVRVPSEKLVRPGFVNFQIEGSSTVTIGQILGDESITPDKVRINLMYTTITTVVWNNGNEDKEETVFIRPNYNGKFEAYVKVDDGNGNKGTIKLSGEVNVEKGTITVAGATMSDKQGTVNYKGVKGQVRVTFLEDDRAIVRIKPEIQTKYSIKVDVSNEFEIDTDIFTINDYKDLYRIDYVADVMNVIKQQLALNKEAELVDELRYGETVMHKNGLYRVIDFNNPPINLQAATVFDYFTIIVPKIIGLARQIEKYSKVVPQYILAGPQTAAFLELLRSVATEFVKGNGATPGGGRLGPTVAANLAFTRFNIVVSHALDEGKLYLVYKSNAPQYTTFIDLEYKPLIISQYEKKHKNRKYITTMSRILILRPEYGGYIEFQGDSWKNIV